MPGEAIATTRIFAVTFVIARNACGCAATFAVARRLAYNENTMTTASADRRQLTAKVRAVQRLLIKAYGEPPRPAWAGTVRSPDQTVATQWEPIDPLDELINTILSQNTNDLNRDRAYRALPELRRLWRATSHIAVWDDHDYGPNDGDASFVMKGAALEVFRRYWPNPTYGLPDVPGTFGWMHLGDVDFFLLADQHEVLFAADGVGGAGRKQDDGADHKGACGHSGEGSSMHRGW